MQLIHGDCLEVLKTLPENSVDSLVTDPPAGISFMGKDWDGDKGGRKQWCAWMESVMRECLRVLKPGAHGLVWAIPRTSHWTATALEDAGFEVRDCITHLFGSGFPKSLDISKAIDKAAGAKREVLGFNLDFLRRNPSSDFKLDGKEYNSGHKDGAGAATITAPATDAAKEWEGWGTALKPAAEFWWLIRKPLSEKTVAANVQKWKTGGINIDACRIAYKSELDKEAAKPQGLSTSKVAKNGLAKASGVYGERIEFENKQNNQGRFPANLVLSHSPNCSDEFGCDMFECAVWKLDAQSGNSDSSYRKPKNKSDRPGLVNFAATGGERIIHNDSGGASRFFFQARHDICLMCENANIAQKSLYLKSLLEDFAQKLAVIEGFQGAKQLSEQLEAFTVEIQKLLKPQENQNIEQIQNTGERCLHELKHIDNSSLSPANYVELQKLTDIIKTILSRLKLNGFAGGATSVIIQPNSEPGAKALNASRFIYCAKISTSERNAGLEGFEEKESIGQAFKNMLDPRMDREQNRCLNKNHHPTVKAKKLMAYLIKLITPPNGIVLDPFTGSGSTGIAAKENGFDFIGIEREKEYFEIAKARIENARK